MDVGGGSPEGVAKAGRPAPRGVDAHGRGGRPRIVALCYFAVGDGPQEQAGRTLGDYYSFLGPYAEMMIDRAAKSAAAIPERIAGFHAAGVEK